MLNSNLAKSRSAKSSVSVRNELRFNEIWVSDMCETAMLYCVTFLHGLSSLREIDETGVSSCLHPGCGNTIHMVTNQTLGNHNCDVTMSVTVSQITGVFIICSAVGSGADQIKYQSSASLAFVWRIHRWPRKGPVKRNMFPFYDVTMMLF